MNKTTEIGLVIVRVTVGLIFSVHGLDKFKGGIHNTVLYFESLGILGIMAYVVATIELIGGIALMLGINTRLAAVLQVPVMLGAIYFVHLPEGLMRSDSGAGYELNLLLIAICILLGLSGSNYFSVYNFLVKKNTSSINIVTWLKEKNK